MKTIFETGATSHQANNLILSVLNDGQVYKDRLHCGYAMLQGSSHSASIKDIITNEANKQRKEFRSTFPAKCITEAVSILTKDTISDCLEIIKDEYCKDFPISTYCRKYWDKTYGNTYFSVAIEIPTADSYHTITIPMQYGYGDHWQTVVLDTLVKIGVLPEFPVYANGNKDRGYMQDYERKGIIIWHDAGYMQKNRMFSGINI